MAIREAIAVLALAGALGCGAGHGAELTAADVRAFLVEGEPGAPPMSFAISAAVRHREPEWKQQVESFLADNREQIDAILRDYGVPLAGDPDAALE